MTGRRHQTLVNNTLSDSLYNYENGIPQGSGLPGSVTIPNLHVLST